MIAHIIVLLVIGGLAAQEDAPCHFPASRPLQIGIVSRICVKVFFPENNMTNLTYVYAYPVTVDKFSVFQLSSINEIINSTLLPVTLKFQFQNSLSQYEISLTDYEKQIYRNTLSIVIQISHGKFKSIYIQTQNCQNCEFPNICENNQCYHSGYLAEESQLYVFVSWIGTDLYDEHMTSHNQRLKKLQKFFAGNIYTSASNIQYPVIAVPEQIVVENDGYINFQQ